MTGLVFVDTSVLLYAIDSRYAAKHRAARDWMERLWLDCNGRTGVQVLSELHVNSTRTLTPPLERAEAWQHVVALREWQPRDGKAARCCSRRSCSTASCTPVCPP